MVIGPSVLANRSGLFLDKLSFEPPLWWSSGKELALSAP